MAEYFSLQAALCFAVSHVLIRRGLVGSNAIAGSFLSLSISAVALWILSLLLVPLSGFRTPAIWYFIVAGIFAPALGRTLNFVGIERVGVARSVPIVNSSPMFASIFAVAWLGEEWTLQNMLGSSLVVLGVIILSTSRTEEGDWRKLDVIYPILGAVSFGISANLRKHGLNIDNVPLVAGAVTASAAFLFALAMLRTYGGSRALRMPPRSFAWLLVAGIINTGAMLSSIYALSFGKVVIVEPLICTNPVLSIFLSAIFLRDLEVITRRVLAGAACTVVGTVLVVTA